MLPSFSRGLRLALVLALSAGYVAVQGHPANAAKPTKGDDDDSGDDDASGGETSDEGDSTAEDDKDQPPVTAGGLFTINTYPVRETLRPLTMTQHITQLRLGLGTDLSSKGAFGSAGLSLEVQHGATDNFTVIGGLTNAYNFKQFSVYAGFEAALAYDLLDVRLAANLHRAAIAGYCVDPTMATVVPDQPANCVNPDGTVPPVPSGNYQAGGMKFSLDLGFPFRYALKPEIALVALQTLISIDFNQARDRARLDAMGQPVLGPDGLPVKGLENGVVPDFNPSVGIAANPIPELSVVAFGQLRIPDFDTDAGSFQVPVTARVEFSPSQKYDIGLEFTLLNVMPPGDQSPFANRFISLFVQSRIGK
jgi:hypothetical protein